MLLETQDFELQVARAVYTILLLGFTLGFLINWYRNREAISDYRHVGLRLALVVLGFEGATILLGITSLLSIVFAGCLALVLALVSIAWLIVRVWAFVNNGIFFCNQLNIRSFPLLAPKLGIPESQPVSVDGISGATASGVVTSNGSDTVVKIPPVETDQPISLAQLEAQSMPTEPGVPAEPTTSLPDQLKPLDRKRYVRDVLIVGLGAVVYTVVLFLLTSPRPGAVARDLGGEYLSPDITAVTLVVILEFALVEELMFRLAIQNYLASKFVQRRYGYWIAIILTSLMWTLGHVGSLDPNWVKMVQIFPIGLALGWLFRRHGAESTILAHGLFNLVATFVATPLYLR